MSVAHAYETVPAFPLGIPVDGRERYGMTPEQAILYRWLVKYRPHDGDFKINMQQAASVMLCKRWNIHERIKALVERGWIKPTTAGRYAFVQPVKVYKGPR